MMPNAHTFILFLATVVVSSPETSAFTSSSFIPQPHTSLSSRRQASSLLRMSAVDISDVKVMVNGMPGPMAVAAAEACLRKGLNLAPVAMTGPDIEPSTITVSDNVSGRESEVRLIPVSDMNEVKAAVIATKEACGENNLLAIDFTHPSAVNDNAIFYAQENIPFVMGTTGGDRDKLLQDVESANHFAVIAPNMGKQIVAMQAALEELATKYPAAFAGYKLQVTESHQKTKADTSGTAKAVIDSLKILSDDESFTDDNITMLRDDESSLDFGVPQDALNGHAFHTYTLTSPDGSVQFELKHNVAGRTVYAEGTADAVAFLARKIRTEPEPTIFTMINVLEEGALE